MPRPDSPAVVALESAVMSEPLADPVRIVAARLRAAGIKVSAATVANIRARAGHESKRGRRPGPYAAIVSAALVAVDRMREYDDAELPPGVTRADLDAAAKWLRDGGLRLVRSRR